MPDAGVSGTLAIVFTADHDDDSPDERALGRA
jgi:hypothetical protein